MQLGNKFDNIMKKKKNFIHQWRNILWNKEKHVGNLKERILDSSHMFILYIWWHFANLSKDKCLVD